MPPLKWPSSKPAPRSFRSSRLALAPSSAAATAAFPETRSFSPSVTDGEGWHAGTRFADQADVSAGSDENVALWCAAVTLGYEHLFDDFPSTPWEG